MIFSTIYLSACTTFGITNAKVFIPRYLHLNVKFIEIMYKIKIPERAKYKIVLVIWFGLISIYKTIITNKLNIFKYFNLYYVRFFAFEIK